MNTDALLRRVPFVLRSVVRNYANSENEHDVAHARDLCAQFSVDHAALRAAILEELIAESRRLGKAWTPAAGSRPLSPERPSDAAPDRPARGGEVWTKRDLERADAEAQRLRDLLYDAAPDRPARGEGER